MIAPLMTKQLFSDISACDSVPSTRNFIGFYVFVRLIPTEYEGKLTDYSTD